jgi:hypothetical protein
MGMGFIRGHTNKNPSISLYTVLNNSYQTTYKQVLVGMGWIPHCALIVAHHCALIVAHHCALIVAHCCALVMAHCYALVVACCCALIVAC